MEEFIVIGAGLAGASCAWHLAALRGQPVTVLERTGPANRFGSSHGSARILRYAYDQQLYTDLVLRARSGWDELERLSARRLVTPTGCLDFGGGQRPRELSAILARAGVEHELLSAAHAMSRWPQFTFDGPVLWHPDAGVLDPEATVATMLAEAVASGHAQVLEDWEATRIEATPAGWRVHSNAGQTVEGSRIIVAAGGWLPELLTSAGLPAALVAAMPGLEVRQEQVFHFPYRETPDATTPWPSFIHVSDELLVYGLPGGRDAASRGQKVAQFNGGPVLTSAREQDGQVRAETRKRMAAYVSAHLPGLVPEPYGETTCLFTNTPNEDFVIDGVDGVIIVSACSGHGAKFAPLLGELAADRAMGTGPVPAAFAFTGASR